MKVIELIELLSKFDPQLEVFIDSYEYGVDYPNPPRLTEVRRIPEDDILFDRSWEPGAMYGRFEVKDGYARKGVPAVYISRKAQN